MECNMYLKIPDGVDMDQGYNKSHVFKIPKNLYRQKQVDIVWNNYLMINLMKIGFRRSLIDKCIFIVEF